MRLKNTFFKWLDKLENVKISPVWGYSFAVCCLFLFVLGWAFALRWAFAQWDGADGGGGYFLLWIYLSELVLLAAIVLIVLTKRSRSYGAKIARIFSVMFLVVSEKLCHYIPSNPQMHGESYFDPLDLLEYLVFIVAGFVGYAVGKYIAKKIKDSNMATVKEELSQS